MSKKRGNKKNVNLENDSDEEAKITKANTEKNDITSKSNKTKSSKKGKRGKKDDWSDEEEGKVVSLIDNVDEEIQPVTKKSAKKSKHVKHMSAFFLEQLCKFQSLKRRVKTILRVRMKM
jgi:hypothetical protein